MIGHENFDAFLAAVGVTPLVAIMVLRSDTMVTIYEDLVSRSQSYIGSNPAQQQMILFRQLYF
jgi:hypothetical protein